MTPDDLETGGVPPAALPHPQPTAISPAEDAAAPGAGQLFDTVDIDIPKPPALLDPDAQEAA